MSRPKPPAGPESETLKAWMSGLTLGPPAQIGELTLVPLIHDQVPAQPDTLIDQAILRGQLELVESNGGMVQQVLARNLGPSDVLVLEGDTLVGCKQNRMVAWSVLVGARTTVPVSVGCMERGRWDRGARPFGAGAMSVDPHIRRRSKRETSASLALASGPRLDQGRAWSDVDDKLREWKATSPSDDYHTGLLSRVGQIRTRLEQLKPVVGQLGVMALHHGHLLGIEVVGHPETWAVLARRVLPSYALGAESARNDREFGWTGRGQPADWLAAVTYGAADFRPAGGKGFDGVIRSGGITGSCLWERGVRHLAVFAT